MKETTLLICDFSEGVTTAENWQGKGSSGRCFFRNLLSEQRLKFFLYWTPSDIVQHKEKALGEKEVAGFIHMESLIEVRKTPLVANPSPFVLDATKATLKIIEEGTLEELSQKSDSPSKTSVPSTS